MIRFFALFCLIVVGGYCEPLGLPPIPWPENNAYTPEKAELGRLLYFDKRLSTDGSISCATCHPVASAFTDHLPVSIGIRGQKGTRHAPTVINSGYLKALFWDGRAKNLEDQCKGPIGNPLEMTLIGNAHEAHELCDKKVQAIPGYKKLFKDVFGCDSCSFEYVAKAIATFERTILSGNSPYDRYINGDKTALTEQQVEGFHLFNKSGCINCHHGPLLTDGRYANIGIGMEKSNPDLGRYLITQANKDWGAFKVPGLREVANTYPYMHDGSLKTLEEVIDYYDKGGNPSRNLHPQIKPLHLTDLQKKALVSFLQALSGEGWQNIQEPNEYPK